KCPANLIGAAFAGFCSDELHSSTPDICFASCKADESSLNDSINPDEAVQTCATACDAEFIPQCEEAQADRVRPICLSNCRSECSDACAPTAPCSTGCIPDCETSCSRATFAAPCFDGCMEGCRATSASPDPRPVYGLPSDLAYNLEDVFDGSGQLVLHNDYGQ